MIEQMCWDAHSITLTLAEKADAVTDVDGALSYSNNSRQHIIISLSVPNIVELGNS